MERIRKFFTKQYDLHSIKEREVPAKGFPRFVYFLTHETGHLMQLNLVFIISCIPVITIPAAICAMDRYLMKMVRNGYGFDLSDYKDEFKADIVKSLPVGILTAFLIIYAYYILSFAGQFNGAKQTYCVISGVICAIAGVLVSSYYFVLQALFELKTGELLNNAGIIIIADWPFTLLVLAEAAFFFVLVFLSLPVSLIYLALIGFSVHQLALCSIINPVIEKRMIKPYEAE